MQRRTPFHPRPRHIWPSALVAAVLLTLAPAAMAQDATPPDGLRPLCPDRPTKGTSPCTVDSGHLQLEAGVADVVVPDTAKPSLRTLSIGAATLKYGVSPNADLELGWTAYESLRDEDAGGRIDSRGVGDLYLRAKLNLTHNRTDGVGIALAPVVKLPTARQPIGNRLVEGGLIVPISTSLPGGWSLTLDPEADLVQGPSGAGREVVLVQATGLTHSIGKSLAASVELWSNLALEHGHPGQASFDLGLAWTPVPGGDLQLDAGLNRGLSRNTPDLEYYVGLSRRF